MLVAIHQPNFLPWLGWFDKLATADIFILLDTVPHQHTGSNYTNRVQVLVRGEPAWITVPVERGGEARNRIDRLRVVGPKGWRRKIRATLAQSYARAPYFAETMPILDAMLGADTELLCEVNLIGIGAIADALGLPRARMVRASEFSVEGTATDRLVALVHAVGGDAYLTGHGAGGYQEDEKFAAAGIAVRYQRYVPAPYPQLRAGAFVPGLSAIDALMNCGPSARSLIAEHTETFTSG
jgi:WbqC-like protein family